MKVSSEAEISGTHRMLLRMATISGTGWKSDLKMLLTEWTEPLSFIAWRHARNAAGPVVRKVPKMLPAVVAAVVGRSEFPRDFLPSCIPVRSVMAGALFLKRNVMPAVEKDRLKFSGKFPFIFPPESIPETVCA